MTGFNFFSSDSVFKIQIYKQIHQKIYTKIYDIDRYDKHYTCLRHIYLISTYFISLI